MSQQDEKDDWFKYPCSTFSVVEGLVIISLSTLIMFTFKISGAEYQSILSNWSQDPIIDIYQPASLSTPCQANETPLFYYNWPGYISGCLCNDGTISQSSCCSDVGNNNKDCCEGTLLPYISSQALDLWDLSTTTQFTNIVRFCAVRLQNYSFYENAPQENKCNSNQKQCGGILSSTENNNYLYCVPSTSKCPIQQIQFSATPVVDSKTNLPWELVSDQGTHSYSLYVNRESTTMLPLSQLRISNTLTTCYDDGEQYIPQADMALDLRSSSCSNSKFSYQGTKLSLIESNYFSINNVKSKIDSVYSDYDYNTKYPFVLLQKNYLMLDMSCRSNLPALFSYINEIDDLKGILETAFILCMIYGAELIFFESWIGFQYPKYLWGFIIFRKKANSFLKSVYVMKFILAISCIVECTILAVHYTSQYNFYSDQLQQSCFDQEIVHIFQGQVDKMYPGYAIALPFILFLIFCSEPNVIYILLMCINPDHYQKQNKQIDNKNNTKNNNNQNECSTNDIEETIPKIQVVVCQNSVQSPENAPNQQPQQVINQQVVFILQIEQPYSNQQFNSNTLSSQDFNQPASNIYQQNNNLSPPISLLQLQRSDTNQIKMYTIQQNNQSQENNQMRPLF